MSKLIDHFPSYMTGGGIFANMTGMPWSSETSISPTMLDIEYFGNRSGLKGSSPLVEKMTCLPDNREIEGEELQRLCTIIKQKYNAPWQRMWDAIEAEYNPIENYDMEEVTTPRVTRKIATNTDISTDTSNTDNIYAFNSSAAVPQASQEGNSSTEGTKANNYTEESTTGENTLTRHGNIGVTTSAQLLEGELRVRRMNFFDIVFDDIDTILTRPSYEGGCCYV